MAGLWNGRGWLLKFAVLAGAWLSPGIFALGLRRQTPFSSLTPEEAPEAPCAVGGSDFRRRGLSGNPQERRLSLFLARWGEGAAEDASDDAFEEMVNWDRLRIDAEAVVAALQAAERATQKNPLSFRGEGEGATGAVEKTLSSKELRQAERAATAAGLPSGESLLQHLLMVFQVYAEDLDLLVGLFQRAGAGGPEGGEKFVAPEERVVLLAKLTDAFAATARLADSLDEIVNGKSF